MLPDFITSAIIREHFFVIKVIVSRDVWAFVDTKIYIYQDQNKSRGEIQKKYLFISRCSCDTWMA